MNRRHESEKVRQALALTGFCPVEEHQLWERRKVYDSLTELEQDLLARRERSILHELSDSELGHLVTYRKEKIPREKAESELIEKALGPCGVHKSLLVK